VIKWKDLYDKIEDARAEGKPLAEVAESLKLPVRTIEAIDRSGRDPAGTPIALPDQKRLIEAAFSTDVGVERDPLQVADGYVWYDVVAITPSRERPLDEVKDQVAARWREQEIAKRLNAKADEILEKLKAGTVLADVAAANHLKVETLSGIKRGGVSPPLSAAVVETIFRTPKDANARGDAAQGGDQLVFRVTDIVVPPLEAESDNSKRVVEVLNRALSEDVLTQYIAQLESEMGVTFNQSALHQVISGGADTGDAD